MRWRILDRQYRFGERAADLRAARTAMQICARLQSSKSGPLQLSDFLPGLTASAGQQDESAILAGFDAAMAAQGRGD